MASPLGFPKPYAPRRYARRHGFHYPKYRRILLENSPEKSLVFRAAHHRPLAHMVYKAYRTDDRQRMYALFNRINKRLNNDIGSPT